MTTDPDIVTARALRPRDVSRDSDLLEEHWDARIDSLKGRLSTIETKLDEREKSDERVRWFLGIVLAGTLAVAGGTILRGYQTEERLSAHTQADGHPPALERVRALETRAAAADGRYSSDIRATRETLQRLATDVESLAESLAEIAQDPPRRRGRR